jgi:hypothetical protein
MCLSADFGAETYVPTRSIELGRNLGARIFIPLHAGLIFILRRFKVILIV